MFHTLINTYITYFLIKDINGVLGFWDLKVSLGRAQDSYIFLFKKN